ncbi:MAG: TadE/TadG family type IV pilus assembly protein [Hyphomicrobium sp.]|nr:pilus assembly protein [Hyphomicrobium sp.]
MRLRQLQQYLKTRATGFKREDDGATAIEFAMVATPFFMLVFMLIGFAMYFFVMNSLEKGMDQTSRLVRTGQAQKNNMTVADFKNQVCNSSGDWIKCPKVQVFVQKYPNWATVAPQECLNVDGSVVTNTAAGTDPIATYTGTASEIVVVTTCYKWEFAQQIPFVKIGNMGDNSMMMQSSTAFRTEPYAAN